MNTSNTSTSRLPWVDALKGWGILLVVVGHVWSLQDISTFYQWIFSFHIPLFFFAAGLTLKLEQGITWGNSRRRASVLLTPYFIFGLLGYAFYVGGYFVAQVAGIHVEQFNYGLLRPLMGIAYGSVGEGLLVNSPIWFLPALLICTILILALNKFTSSTLLRYAVLIVFFSLGYWVSLRAKLPFSAASALCAAIFMQMGLDLKDHIISYQRHRRLAFLIMLVFFSFTALAPVNGDVGLAGPTINHPVWFITFATVGTLASVALILFLQSLHGLNRLMQIIGQHSLAILVVHMLIIKTVKVIFSIIFNININTIENDFEWGLIILITSSLFIIPTSWAICKYLPRTVNYKK